MRPVLVLMLSLLLCACGGGGSGGGGGGNRNSPPVADAGGDANARPGFQVFLDGSDSSDADGEIVRYQWSQQEGPAVTLFNSSSDIAQFTAPQVSADTRLGFSLRVTDDAGASDTDTVFVTVQPPASSATFRVAGTVSGSPSQVLDSDINNPAQPSRSNNSIDTAQPISNPITVGGYVNQPGSGAEGASTTLGDIDDYYRVDLLRGQVVTMLVADFAEADADLYLLDEQGVVVDSSVELGEVERVAAPADGAYFVNANAFDGATNYILAIGNQTAGLGRRPEIVPWQAVLELRDGGDDAGALGQRMAMQRSVGSNGPQALYSMRIGATLDELRARLDVLLDKRDRFEDEQQRAH